MIPGGGTRVFVGSEFVVPAVAGPVFVAGKLDGPLLGVLLGKEIWSGTSELAAELRVPVGMISDSLPRAALPAA